MAKLGVIIQLGLLETSLQVDYADITKLIWQCEIHGIINWVGIVGQLIKRSSQIEDGGFAINNW